MGLTSRFIVVTVLLTSFAFTTRGQDTLTIRGIVIDKSGNPLVGCNVMIKGTTNGTVTDICGEFSMPVGQDDFTIVLHDMTYEDLRTFELGLKIEEITEDKVVFQIGSGTKENRDCKLAIGKGLKRYRIR